eukprot:15446_1
MSNNSNQWTVSWRNCKYQLAFDDQTTINDFKQQLQTITNVKATSIKFIGLKINKKYKRKIKKIEANTLIIYLQCTSKKKNIFKMIGSLQNEIFDVNKHCNLNRLIYNKRFTLTIYGLFRTHYAIPANTVHIAFIPIDLVSLVLKYFDIKPFVFTYFKINNKYTKITNNGLHLTYHHESNANITGGGRNTILLGPILDMKHMSKYECRLKILELKTRNMIFFGVFDSKHDYSKRFDFDEQHNGLNDRPYENCHFSDWNGGGYWSQDMHRKGDEFNRNWSAKNNEITLNRLQRTGNAYPNVEFELNKDDIVNVCVDCVNKKVEFLNEENGNTFVIKGLNENCRIQMLIMGYFIQVEILEQFCLFKSCK